MKFPPFDPETLSNVEARKRLLALSEWANLVDVKLYKQNKPEPSTAHPSTFTVNTREDTDPRLIVKKPTYEESRKKWRYREDDHRWVVDPSGINHLVHKLNEEELRAVQEDIIGFDMVELDHEEELHASGDYSDSNQEHPSVPDSVDT